MSWLEFSPISPQLWIFLTIGLLLIAAKLVESAFGRFLRLGTLAALLLGLFLGPTGRDILNAPWLAGAAGTEHFQTVFADLAAVCTWVLLFAVGLRLRFTGGPRFALAVVLAAAGSGVGGFWVAWKVAQKAGIDGPAALLLGAVGGAVSVTVTAASARELGKDSEPETAAAMTGWLVSNVWVWAVLTLAVAQFAQPDRSTGAAWTALLKSGVFLACVTLLGYALFTWIGLLLSRLQWPGLMLAWGLTSALVMAVAAEYFAGVPAVTGALLAGMIFARLPQADTVAEQLRGLVDGIAVPLLLVSLALHVDLRAAWADGGGSQLLLSSLLLLLGKLIPAGLLTRATGATWLASLRVGAGLAAPGESALMLVAVAVSAGGLTAAQAGTATVLATLPMLVQPALLWLAWYVGRNPAIVTPPLPHVPERGAQAAFGSEEGPEPGGPGIGA